MSNAKKIWITFGAVFLVAVAFVVGFAYHTAKGILNIQTKTFGGQPVVTPPGNLPPVGVIAHLIQLENDPQQGFPGQHKTTILCMGIDDSWTDTGDEVYTTHSRTDTLFLLTLDLDNKTATMLSIPRDTYTHIAGTSYSSKINSAYATGGPDRTMATFAEMTGITPDHYMVLNINATKDLVDALGGVDVTVEHPMHYHDKWGHLSIDLEPGFQHLDGDQAMGFVRYRHPDEGGKPSGEDGDERRMYRQHVMMQAMIHQAKSFTDIVNLPKIMTVAVNEIRTDLSTDQLYDLAIMYKGMQPGDMVTASLPGTDFIAPDGGWDYRLYPDKMKDYLAWLVDGDQTAARALTPVVVKNGSGVTGLAAHAEDQLKQQGYTDVQIGGNASLPAVAAAPGAAPATGGVHFPQTTIVDSGVSDKDATTDVATVLGISQPVIQHEILKANRRGWMPEPHLTVIVGTDYAQSPAGTAAVASAPTPASN